MYGEALVFLRRELGETAPFVRKQAGQLASKMRFVAAQFLALLEGDRWIATAAHANRMAARLAERLSGIDGIELSRRPEVNAVFVRLPPAAVAELQAWSFVWPWDVGRREVRVMTSFDTTEQDVDRFAEGVAAIVAAT
jgi:threonine aldolase